MLTLAFELAQQDLLIGVTKGLTYAALAAGFVLIYRTTGVLNFAHAETGALGLAIFVLLLVRYDVNWWVAFVISVVIGALMGMVVELVVVRRLFASPRLVLLIATIGVAQLMQFIKVNLPSVNSPGPIPLPFTRVFGDARTDSLVLRPRDYMVIIIIPAMILGLGAFLTRTRLGLAVRGTSSNADTARIYGTSPRNTSTVVWTLSGALAVASAVLFAPYEVSNAAAAGTAALAAPLLLKAVTVALIAQMRSLPMVLVGGVAVGVVEQVVLANTDDRALVNVYLFLTVLVIVLLLARGRSDDTAWSLTPEIEPIPERLKSIWWVRNINALGFTVLFGLLGVLGIFLQANSKLFIWTGILVVAMVGVSLSLLTGWAGQLSLGQFAFVGLGAVLMVALTSGNEWALLGRGFQLEWIVALAVTLAICVGVAVLIGLPALRVRGLFLAVVTLAFAVAASSWFFTRDVFTGGSTATRPIPKPVLGPFDFADRKSFYFLCLVGLGLVCALVAHLRRTGIGRAMIAVRDNQEAAAASTVSPNKIKLTAFAISGGIAAFAGAMFATFQSAITPTEAFSPQESIDVVAVAIIGGLGSVSGPVLGALWVQGLPAAWGGTPPDLITLLTSSIGLLLLLMYFPGGIQQLVYIGRGALVSLAERRLGPAEAEPSRAQVAAVPTRHAARQVLEPEQAALRTEGVSVHFGGNYAVDGVDFHVMPDELVGLIGTNGAGKSTLLNAISGFVPSEGRIEVLGRSVEHLPAHKRHRLGLGRGFQAARLYPDLNVRETLMIALEARERSLVIPSMLALPRSVRAERLKRSEAEEIIGFLGLGHYADSYISGLSTGTRRVVELGCLLAADAQVLLLDEPTGGVAQKETEAFGPLIRRIQAELEAAVVVIEHDMPLVMSISDRVYCLEAGAIIAEGVARDVRDDPAVIASYLGTDERAIARSDLA